MAIRRPSSIAQVVLLLGLLVGVPQNAWPQAVDPAQNLRNCRTGVGVCNHRLLTPGQLAEVKEAGLRRNLQNCRPGLMNCDPSLLSAQKLQETKELARQRNVRNCRFGYISCDPRLLSREERVEVEEFARRRNLQSCRSGYVNCDTRLLSAEEFRDVERRARARNLQNYRLGYFNCDRRLLSQQELVEVERLSRRRNLVNCRLGYFNCDRSLLTSNELAEIEELARRRNLQNCRLGYSNCSYNQLTAEDLNEIQVLKWRRNVASCEKGYASCDQVLLNSPPPRFGDTKQAGPTSLRAQVESSSAARSIASVDSGSSRSPRVPAVSRPLGKTKHAVPRQSRPRSTIPANTPATSSDQNSRSVLDQENTDGLAALIVYGLFGIVLFMLLHGIVKRIHLTSPTRANVEWTTLPNAGTANVPSLDWKSPAEVVSGESAYTEEGNLCPVDARPFELGAAVARCRTLGCQTAYHQDCWDFIQRENASVCVSCQQSNGVTTSRIERTASSSAEDVVECPRCRTRNRVNLWLPRAGFRCGRCKSSLFPAYADSFSETVVDLPTVRHFVGRIVVFRGDVVEMRKTRSGAYLLKFERGHTRNVFKLYIPDRYVAGFRSTGTKIENYLGSTLEVRGLVQRHPKWNLEIVVTEPNAIRVVTASERYSMA